MFDSLAVAAIADEIRDFVGGRVQRIVQSDPLTLGLELYALGQRRWLVATANPQRAGAWLVSGKIGQSPEAPSPILLLMRKHLRGARLEAVEQPPYERVLRLRFARWFDDGDDSPHGDKPESPAPDGSAAIRSLELIVEAMGRLGNVILLDEAGTILEAIKRVPPTINRHRTILPRRPYVGPPAQTKAAPTEATPELLGAALSTATGTAAGTIVGVLRGLSPLAAREAVHRAAGRPDAPADAVDPARLAAAIAELIAPLEPGTGAIWRPSLGFEDDRAVAFAPHALTHLPRFMPTETLSEAVERFFGQPAARSPLAQAQTALRGEVEAMRGREARRIESLERELAAPEEVDALREAGELLLAYASQITPGSASLEVDGRSIALDPTLTPVENAQRYFERYTRARDARKRLPEMIDEVRARIAYLDETLIHLALATTPEQVAALRAELRPEQPRREGRESRPTKGRERGPVPLRVRLGAHVAYVGRSAKQNDAVTFGLAGPRDLWLHARGVAGAHLILRVEGERPDQRTIERAAAIAAFHSEARDAARVPVDVTERRYVRKIKGAPGAVTYSGQRTLTVAPKPPDEA